MKDMSIVLIMVEISVVYLVQCIKPEDYRDGKRASNKNLTQSSVTLKYEV